MWGSYSLHERVVLPVCADVGALSGVGNLLPFEGVVTRSRKGSGLDERAAQQEVEDAPDQVDWPEAVAGEELAPGRGTLGDGLCAVIAEREQVDA